MAAVRVCTELYLVHGHELDAAVQRHRLHRAAEPARTLGDDLLLAGDQRHAAGALGGHHAIVVLARQQAQREADDAGAVAQEAGDRQVGLARVRRAQHGAHPGGEHVLTDSVACLGHV